MVVNARESLQGSLNPDHGGSQDWGARGFIEPGRDDEVSNYLNKTLLSVSDDNELILLQSVNVS